MKSLIIIVSLIVSAEYFSTPCCGKLTDSSNDDPDKCSNHQTKVDIIGQNGMDDTKTEILKSVPHIKSQRSLDFRTSMNIENGILKPRTIVDEEKKNQVTSLTSVDEMMTRAIANRENAIENAKLKYEKMKTSVNALKEQADMGRDNTLKHVNEQCRKAESMASTIMRNASKQVAEARMKAKTEYNQEVSLADEELRKAVEEFETAYKAAADEFMKVRNQIEENKQEVESKHQDELEKARKERETALGSAKERMEKAKEDYEKAMGRKSGMKSKDAANAESDHQKEIELYQKTLELANDEWLKALDAIGIGREYEEALQNAVKELELSQQDATVIFKDAIKTFENDLEAAKTKRREINGVAKAGSLKLQDEYEKIIEKADNYRADMSMHAWCEWKKIETQANEELQKANTEFFNDEKQAIDEWRNAMSIINEMKRKSAQEAKTESMTPEKIIRLRNPQNRKPRRKVSHRGAGKNDPTMASHT